MVYETILERYIRRKLKEYYNSREISMVEKIDDDTFRAKLRNGNIVFVFANEDGSIDFREEYAVC